MICSYKKPWHTITRYFFSTRKIYIVTMTTKTLRKIGQQLKNMYSTQNHIYVKNNNLSLILILLFKVSCINKK